MKVVNFDESTFSTIKKGYQQIYAYFTNKQSLNTFFRNSPQCNFLKKNMIFLWNAKDFFITSKKKRFPFPYWFYTQSVTFLFLILICFASFKTFSRFRCVCSSISTSFFCMMKREKCPNAAKLPFSNCRCNWVALITLKISINVKQNHEKMCFHVNSNIVSP